MGEGDTGQPSAPRVGSRPESRAAREPRSPPPAGPRPQRRWREKASGVRLLGSFGIGYRTLEICHPYVILCMFRGTLTLTAFLFLPIRLAQLSPCHLLLHGSRLSRQASRIRSRVFCLAQGLALLEVRTGNSEQPAKSQQPTLEERGPENRQPDRTPDTGCRLPDPSTKGP